MNLSEYDINRLYRIVTGEHLPTFNLCETQYEKMLDEAVKVINQERGPISYTEFWGSSINIII